MQHHTLEISTQDWGNGGGGCLMFSLLNIFPDNSQIPGSRLQALDRLADRAEAVTSSTWLDVSVFNLSGYFSRIFTHLGFHILIIFKKSIPAPGHLFLSICIILIFIISSSISDPTYIDSDVSVIAADETWVLGPWLYLCSGYSCSLHEMLHWLMRCVCHRTNRTNEVDSS